MYSAPGFAVGSLTACFASTLVDADGAAPCTCADSECAAVHVCD